MTLTNDELNAWYQAKIKKKCPHNRVMDMDNPHTTYRECVGCGEQSDFSIPDHISDPAVILEKFIELMETGTLIYEYLPKGEIHCIHYKGTGENLCFEKDFKRAMMLALKAKHEATN